MRNIDYFRNKKITIIGLARSGLACANLLFDLGAQVSVTDSKDCEATRRSAAMLRSGAIKLELGRHSKDFIQSRDLIVVSPGVTNDALPLAWAKELMIPVVSEIEVGWLLCSGTIIAVTGSGGKTTVTTLIGKIIGASGRRGFVCGNIGNPFTSEVANIGQQDFVSLEISSFQLERIKGFHPKVAVMLNFSRNHLDRHADMQEYLNAKKRIFMNQDKDDFLVLNSQDPVLKELANETKSKVVFFQQDKDLNPNQAAVAAVGSILGIDKEVCLEVFAEFKGLEHRMEFVAEVNRVKFFNDSKATLVESTVWAIKNIKQPVILIAGGKDKGVDYAGIIPEAKEKVKEVILIGEARNKIRASLENKLLIDEAGSLEEAVHKAYNFASPGDCVLLSPMCSSFDMFSSYEERGKVFKQVVRDLVKSENK